MNSQETCDANRLLHLKEIANGIHIVLQVADVTDRDAVNALMANLCERLHELKDDDLVIGCVRQLAVVLGMITRENEPCST